MSSLSYQCCFCGQAVSFAEGTTSRLDPCALVLIGNCAAPEAQQLSQQFFCHLECFKRRITVAEYINLEVMEPGDQA